MANIDVSELLSDPDFTDTATLIRRASSINGFGELELTETPETITAVIQGPEPMDFKQNPDAAWLTDAIAVWWRGSFTVEAPGGYSDVVVWHGKRYICEQVQEDYINWGTGWTRALFRLEKVNNG